MKLSNTFLINGSDGDRVAEHWEHGKIEIRLVKSSMTYSDALVFEPSENDVKRQGDDWRGDQHGVAEDDVLGVVTGGHGDSAPGVGFLFVMAYGHVIGVERCHNQDRDIQVQQRIDLEGAESLYLLPISNKIIILHDVKLNNIN